MKFLPASPLLICATVAAFSTGCTTAEIRPSAASKTSASVTGTPAGTAINRASTATAPLHTSLPLPALAPAVAATVAHLTQTAQTDTLPHRLSDTTSFPDALPSLSAGAHAPKIDYVDDGKNPPPRGLTAEGNSTALVERDWSGLVLVPIDTSLSKAHTVAVRLAKVEAHPLRDGRIRVWIRLQNIGRGALNPDIACAFRMQSDTTPVSPYFYELDVPVRGYRDVFFISPVGSLISYTVLVRPSRGN